MHLQLLLLSRNRRLKLNARYSILKDHFLCQLPWGCYSLPRTTCFGFGCICWEKHDHHRSLVSLRFGNVDWTERRTGQRSMNGKGWMEGDGRFPTRGLSLGTRYQNVTIHAIRKSPGEDQILHWESPNQPRNVLFFEVCWLPMLFTFGEFE